MNLFNYKLTVSYLGTSYSGWQIQSQGEKTIQGEIDTVLKKITKSDNIKTLGSGRTDAGVHAFGQVFKATFPLDINPSNLLKAMNSHLPDEICIISAEVSNEEFHPIRDSISKEYWYTFSTDKKTPFMNGKMAFLTSPVDIEAIKKGCEVLEGEHDFSLFYCQGSELRSTIRTIYKCSLEKKRGEDLFSGHCGDYYILKFKGSGFLKQMVRLIVGALWNLGTGKITIFELEEALRGIGDEKLGPTAPAAGLYLKEVIY